MYFYTLNYSRFTADLCRLEMKSLFNQIVEEKYFFSEQCIETSRSPFIKDRLTLIYEGDSLDSLVTQVLENQFAAENFRVNYLRLEGTDQNYQERLRWGRELGTAIDGEADMHQAKVTFGVTCIRGRWIFGLHEKNDFSWHHHDNKPYTYSSSINFRVARSLVNIAVGPDTSLTLIDPCCGVGTVVIEALSMGIKAIGYEINKPIAIDAQQNLAFFGYQGAITEGDMHSIGDHFDVAIIDIPYGLYTPITIQEQQDIISTARRICRRMILVSYENMDQMIIASGFTLIDKVSVAKGQMVRYVNVCE